MSFFSKKLKKPLKTQIIAEGLVLDELIKDNILKELKEKFSEEGEMVTGNIQFYLLPKKEALEKIKLEKGEKIVIKPVILDFVKLDHPSPEHFKNKVVVVTTTKNKILEKFLK